MPRTVSIPAIRSLLAATFAATVLMIGGCGGDAAAEPEAMAEPPRDAEGVIDISGTDAVGENLAGSVAPLVECRDWNGATEDQRLATIEDVRNQVDRPDEGIRVPSLTDEEATMIFDNACEPVWAAGFRLYKLYARAVAFAPLARELEP